MKRILSSMLLVLSLMAVERGASATIACQWSIPRCVSGTCGGWGGQDYVSIMGYGSHQSPQYSGCPGAGVCTNDHFRNPSSWDYVASSADYTYIWYASNPVSTIGAASDAVFDTSLENLMAEADWQDITSIDYVDIDVAWSTYNQQSMYLAYSDAEGGSSSSIVYEMTGDYPNGTLLYWRVLNDPSNGQPWTKAKFANWRNWTIHNYSIMDAGHPGGLFIQSITETVGFEFNGTSCPAPVIIR